MGNATPVIAGSWREQSGKIWHSSQNGNTFTWTQEGSGRIATGSMVATSVTPGLSGWVIHMTFDGNVHWRLRPNSDGTVLHGLSDNFTRVSTGYGFVQPTVYNVFGMNSNVMANSSMNVQVLNSVYTENSGKTWIVNSNPHAGYFIMKNQQDGRQVECYVAKDLSNNRHVIYMQFQGTSAPLRGETFDIGQIQLSNGDCFRRTHNPTIITPVTPQPNYGISIGNSGLNISFTTPTTTIIPPQQQQPMYVNPNTSYMPPPQPFQQPQFQQPMMPPPQPFQQPFQQPYQQSSVIITTTPSYGQTSNLANTIVNACQGKNFDKDKMHIVTTYSQSQVSPLSASDLVRVIAMFNFESDKEKVIKQLKQTNNIAGMDCNSAANIVRLFNHDSNKVNVIQDLCPFIFDRRQNAEVLIRYLSFSSSQNSVREYLFSH